MGENQIRKKSMDRRERRQGLEVMMQRGINFETRDDMHAAEESPPSPCSLTLQSLHRY